MAQASFVKDQGVIDYTPGSAVTAGDVIVIGHMVCVAKTDIAANAKGSLATEGDFDFVKKTGAVAAGDIIFWDADGDPVEGDTGSGAASTVRSAGDKIAGHAIAAAGANDETVRVRLNHYTS